MRAALVVSLWAQAGCSLIGFYETPPVEHQRGEEPFVSTLVGKNVEQVDLLFVVDDSNSMREEQASLAENASVLLDAVTSPPDDDGDGEPDYPPVTDLQIGVVSTDMGTNDYPMVTCDEQPSGKNGILQHTPSPDVVGCDASYPAFLTFDGDEGFANDLACIATLGTGGCGFEQQLLAAEKALTVQVGPGQPNEGFLRPDALLGIVVVSDEEDCSVADLRMFTDDDSLGPLNLRCFAHPELVRPIEGLIANVLALKPGHPELVVAAGIVGVPPDLVELSDADLAAPDIQTTDAFDAILADPRMEEQVDYGPIGGGNRLVPSCDVPDRGLAFPPRRIVQWIRDIDVAGNGGIVQSICQADWAPTMRAIGRMVQVRSGGACLTFRPFSDGAPVESGAHADCILTERLDSEGACPPGRVDRGVVDGHRLCHFCQIGDGEGAYAEDAVGGDVTECAGSALYWSYDLDEPGCRLGRVAYSEGAAPDPTSTLTLDCY